MDNIESKVLSTRYRGRFAQIPIYLGKFFRMFVYQSDWKVIPMAAFLAALISMVVKKNFFVNMEGTTRGAFAITCVALWNGLFNSVQVVCRERNVIKREHRSGMHISSYIVSHTIYQACLCMIQSLVMVTIFLYTGVKFPTSGTVTGFFLADFLITLFLITFAADMLALFVSCVVKNTTAAMTVMPMILMVQLIFSGGFFTVPDNVQFVKGFMISNYGMSAICSEAGYNELPSTTAWNLLKKISKQEDADPSLKMMVEQMKANGDDKKMGYELAKSNYNERYENTVFNIELNWIIISLLATISIVASIVVLEFIDKDRR
ncbi:MAG: ABC transporter permease [Eubacterium sp.]|nr:ABC transporter permease [Eubacterium sp.]